MPDREKVIKGLEYCTHTDGTECPNCPYWPDNDCVEALNADVLAMLKEQKTTSTGKTRIFECEKCGYGIDDIYLSNEHDFDVYPHYCPNCGRKVLWDA